MSDLAFNDKQEAASAQVSILDEEKVKVGKWLDEELRRTLGDKSDLDQKIREWYNLYEATPKVKRKSFPWDGAANLVVPVAAVHIESVVSRFVGALFGTGDIWKTIPKSAKWVPASAPLERWINWVGKEVLKIYEVVRSWLLSTAKTGTGILKLTWEEHKRNLTVPSGNGGLTKSQVTTHNGPILRNVMLSDFMVSSDALCPQDIQSCEWVAHRTILTRKQLSERENFGIYTNVEKVIGTPRTSATEIQQDTNTRVGINPSQLNDYEVWEVWCSMDIDGDGISEELVVDIHLDTSTVLRAIYNPYSHQERPFHIIRHMPRDNHLLGIGLCSMLADIQEEITTMHNQRLDNGTLSNMKAWKRKTGCKVTPGQLYPGAVLDVLSMDDIEPMEMGTQHSTMLQEELHSNSIGEKRSGVSDYTVGRESAAIGSRATATSTLALIGEGNKRFQFSIRDVKEALGNIAQQIIGLYQQFAANGEVSYEMFDETEKYYIMQYFKLPSGLSRNNVLIDVPAIDEANNKSVNQQTYMTLIQMLEKIYMGIMQSISVVMNPQIPDLAKQVAAQAAQGASAMMQKLLESFDIVDTKAYVPDLSMLGGMNGNAVNGGNQAGEVQQVLGGNAQGNVPMDGGMGGGAFNGEEPPGDMYAPGENPGSSAGNGFAG